MKKTLYISDLDGTLLTPDQTVSPASAAFLNRFIEAGGIFSLATARSPIGLALLDLGGVPFRTPLVICNGAVSYDYTHKKILQSCNFSKDKLAQILQMCAQHGKYPFIYREIDGRFCGETQRLTSEGERRFFEKRRAIHKDAMLLVERYPHTGGVMYLSMQDTYAVLKPLKEELDASGGVKCVLYADNYMENNWYLEIFREDAGKDNGARRLKQLLGAEGIVAFGDNLNDIPLLQAADVACVVENGREEAKPYAHHVIGPNDRDGVARFIAAREGMPF